MSELLDHLRNKENEHLDHILLELYERELASGNMQGRFLLVNIILKIIMSIFFLVKDI